MWARLAIITHTARVLSVGRDIVDEVRGQVLRRNGTVFAEVQVLTNARGSNYNAAAPTAANIRSALEAMLRARGKHDTVLVALSGHGVQLEVKDRRGKTRTEGFFC